MNQIAQHAISELTSRLQSLSPSILEIIDQSMAHAGHPQGAGQCHLLLKIASEKFVQMNMLTAHRMIYQTIGSLADLKIHALSIEIIK